ncbi:hypothetical protein HK104_007967, partial [Borealophlyctis nickersoniae]
MVMRTYARLRAEADKGFVGHRVAERTSMYTGVPEHKIKALVAEAKNLKDGEWLKASIGCLRGKYIRPLAHGWSAKIREIVDERNKAGQAVTVNIIRNVLNEQALAVFGETVSKRVVKRLMKLLGYHWKKVKNLKCYVETDNIRDWRALYLRACASIRKRAEDLAKEGKPEEEVEVWLDESYCNQHHVMGYTWVDCSDEKKGFEGVDVKRGNK